MNDFVLQNWASIAAVCLGVINLLIIIIKKRVKVVDSVWTYVLSELPEWICTVERHGYDGQKKMAMVVNYALKRIQDLTGEKSKVICDKYADRVTCAVEDILACPQKKGATDEK